MFKVLKVRVDHRVLEDHKVEQVLLVLVVLVVQQVLLLVRQVELVSKAFRDMLVIKVLEDRKDHRVLKVIRELKVLEDHKEEEDQLVWLVLRVLLEQLLILLKY